MKFGLRAALFVLLAGGFGPASAQSGVLVAPLPDSLDDKRALEITGQVFAARGWNVIPQDRYAIEAEKERSAMRVFIDEKGLRFNDRSARRGGTKQRDHRETPYTAVPQDEIDGLRSDLLAAFAGKTPLPPGAAAKVPSQVLLGGIYAGAEPQKVMAATRNAFIGRRWEVRNEADGAIVARIQNIDNNAELHVFLADGALRYIDRTTNRKGEKSKVPDRWLNFVRGDLQVSLNMLAREERSPLPPRETAASPPDATERLLRLKRLLDGGLISPAEYEAKRAEILKSL